MLGAIDATRSCAWIAALAVALAGDVPALDGTVLCGLVFGAPDVGAVLDSPFRGGSVLCVLGTWEPCDLGTWELGWLGSWELGWLGS